LPDFFTLSERFDEASCMNALSANAVVAIVGLGYVGLPVAVAFGSRFRTIGYDVSEAKVNAYRKGVDPVGEVSREQFGASTSLEFCSTPERLAQADFIVVAVPTPVDAARQPDFAQLVSASTAVGRHMKRGATVIYESTVYPGATEEVCVPVLEKHSGMKWRSDFHVAYSPERINPGDREHTLQRIVKVVAADDADTLARVGVF
jgi:UDP-N-acetyl-D-glucosamine/UDP-N-acetyl-D-galactosamine dehydrogenase